MFAISKESDHGRAPVMGCRLGGINIGSPDECRQRTKTESLYPAFLATGRLDRPLNPVSGSHRVLLSGACSEEAADNEKRPGASRRAPQSRRDASRSVTTQAQAFQ